MTKIYAYEIKVETIKDFRKLKQFILTTNSQIYCTEYSNDTSIMARIGFLGYKLKQIKPIINQIYKLNIKIVNIKRVTVPLWHYDVELDKFLAFNLYRDIIKFQDKYKNIYKKVESRQYDDFNYPVTSKNITTLTPLDYLHLFHHLFNFQGIDYTKEVYIYDRCKAIIENTWKRTNVKD